MRKPYHISFIGSGNVASHLAVALYSTGNIIDTIISATEENAKALAAKVEAHFSTDLTSIPAATEIVIVAVKDDAIADVASKLNAAGKIVAHTSGSVDMGVLNSSGGNSGVFYPLQTFHKDKELDILQVPFCIEGINKETENTLLELAKSISANVQLVNSAERKVLHVAAVFACNFSNHYYAIASDILQKENLSLDLLRPLILETAQQMQTKEPKELQTGPAKRNDEEVIKRHLTYLADNPDYAKLYELVTESIRKTHSS